MESLFALRQSKLVFNIFKKSGLVAPNCPAPTYTLSISTDGNEPTIVVNTRLLLSKNNADNNNDRVLLVSAETVLFNTKHPAINKNNE